MTDVPGLTMEVGLIRTALDAIVACDASGRILIFNSAAERLFQHSADAVIGQPLDRLIPERFRGLHHGWMTAFGSGPRDHRRMRSPGMIFALRADGSECPIEASISHTSSGGQQVFVVVMRDISDRIAAEAEKRAAERRLTHLNQRLEMAIKGSGFGVWEFDLAEGRLVWDPVMHELYGFPPGGFAGEVPSWRACIHPDDQGIVDARFEELLAGRPVPNFVFRATRADDQRSIIIEANGYLQVGDDGSPQRLVGMNRDVTDRVHSENELRRLNAELESRVAERTQALQKAVDEAERANLAKSEFLANISHELRTPLHSILGFARLSLDDEHLDPLHRRAFERVSRSGETLLALVNDLLDSARIEAGTFELMPGRMDLAAVLRQLIEELGTLAAGAGLRIETDLLDAAPMVGDSLRLAQAVRNVLANAIRFAPPGSTIGLVLDREDGCYRISISDRGPGIPVDELEVVFDKFVQSSATKNGAGGTGLGLPITRGIVRAHGGDVWAERLEPQGARFVLRLPANRLP